MNADNSIYSEIILDYYKNPINFGKLKKTSVTASGGYVSCGDTVELFVLFGKDGKVKDISFTGQGCAISRAGACVVTEFAKGKTYQEILDLTPEEVFKDLGGVIQTRIKCALLGLNVLKKAISEWSKKPTKKLVLKGINI